MKYDIFNLIGMNCITADDGQKIYDLIYPYLRQNEDVEIDFVNVRIVASPFLNAAIGQLMKDIEPDKLNQHLKITNLSVTAKPVLKRVIENARSYYNDPLFRDAVDAAIQHEAGIEDGI